uniref:Peptidase M14 carboxypeptidase A domain-containing protein n=1 Tax=Ditylenchus dipsaci TaxID=166011 RepID=A0A915DW01_9BILA
MKGLSSGLSWIFAIFCSLPLFFASTYRGYKLYRFEPNDAALAYMDKLEAEANRFTENDGRMPIIDIWSEANVYRKSVDVLVAPEFARHFVAALRKRGVLQIDLLKNDIQRDIDREKRRTIKRTRRSGHHNQLLTNSELESLTAEESARHNRVDFDLNSYNRYSKIVDYLQNLVQSNPDTTQLLNITKTFEGRDLVGIKIAKLYSSKPTVFIDAGIHAREWIAPAVALYLIDRLVNNNSPEDHQITLLTDNFDFVIFPMANPDGYEYSHTKDRFWRKTRSRNLTSSKWCVGADGNRNWGYQWGEAGANRSPCSNIYTGASPFSEQEMTGIRDYIATQISDLKVYISLHSYGQLFLSPWGYTEEKPHNYEDQRMAAKLAVEAIKNSTGANYYYGTIAELMYPASGTSIDYWQAKGVPYIYGIELRPEDLDDNYGFTIPAEWIAPTGQEMLVALKKIGEYVAVHKRI